MARFARERRAHTDFIDAELVDVIDQVLVEQRAGGDGGFLRVGIDDVNRGDAAQDALAQRFDDFTALDQRLHGVAAGGSAIRLGDDEILRHIHETTCQVARVGGLERRVGQALTRPVRRNEVLKNVQAFTEVRGDRRFDDRAIRLGHQAAHAGELANLRRGTARAGVGHHVDRVERLLAHVLPVTVDDRLGGKLLHHGLADLVAGLAPDVDHVVVALLRGDQA